MIAVPSAAVLVALTEQMCIRDRLIAMGLVLVGMGVPALLTLGHLGCQCRLGHRGGPPRVVILGAFGRIGPLGPNLPGSRRDRPLIVVEVEPVAVQEYRPRAEDGRERVVEADQLLEAEPVQGGG